MGSTYVVSDVKEHDRADVLNKSWAFSNFGGRMDLSDGPQTQQKQTRYSRGSYDGARTQRLCIIGIRSTKGTLTILHLGEEGVGTMLPKSTLNSSAFYTLVL